MLRPATPDDLPFMRAMLVDAAFPPGAPRPADPLADDRVARYLDGWGSRPGDLGLVAWVGDQPVGAAWTRRMAADRPGYGFVAEVVPELTVAVSDRHRRRGLGRALVVGALDLAAAHGSTRVSLSVAERTNPGAAELYRKLGFAPAGGDGGGSTTMVAPTTPAPPAPAPADGPAPAVRRASAGDGPALARLREVMFVADGQGGHPGWVDPFLHRWADETPPERLVAMVADDGRGRVVASALAELTSVMPGPGREDGRMAYVSSVATEPAWRGRGLATACMEALLAFVDDAGIGLTRLAATSEAEGIYTRLGFARSGHPAMRRRRPGP